MPYNICRKMAGWLGKGFASQLDSIKSQAEDL